MTTSPKIKNAKYITSMLSERLPQLIVSENKLPSLIQGMVKPQNKSKHDRDYNTIVNQIFELHSKTNPNKRAKQLLNLLTSQSKEPATLQNSIFYKKRMSLPEISIALVSTTRHYSASNRPNKESKEIIKYVKKRKNNELSCRVKHKDKSVSIVSISECNIKDRAKKHSKAKKQTKKVETVEVTPHHIESPKVIGSKVQMSIINKHSKTREEVKNMIRLYENELKLPPIHKQTSPSENKKHVIQSKSTIHKEIKEGSTSLEMHPISSSLNHPINTAFHNLNSLLHALSQKEQKIKLVVKRAHKALVAMSSHITYDDLKSREWNSITKEKMVRATIEAINRANDVSYPPRLCLYRYYVGNGNNAALVKTIMNKRWWWVSVEKKELETANFAWTQLVLKKFIDCIPTTRPSFLRMCNHLENHVHLSNKKALFLNLQEYYLSIGIDPFTIIPLTFHIKSINDAEMERFNDYYHSAPGIWIVKPGEFTNRGKGIKIYSELSKIQERIRKKTEGKTYIVQKYIQNPLLINKRKFDIRCYSLATSVNAKIKAYFYSEGYLRTSSKEFSIKNISNKFIHLTNDAVQKSDESYGKYESANKLSYNDLQKYVDTNYPNKGFNFQRDVNQTIKKVIADTFKATYKKIDPNKRQHTFELFGYDFMIDDEFKIYLIEVNSNPCLETCCTLLTKLIPTMLDNALRYYDY